MERHARWLVVAAAVLFSTGGAAIKTDAFSALQVSSVRSGVAAITLLLLMAHRARVTLPILALGAAYAATLTLFVAATKLTTAASAIFLQSTAPLYLLVIGPLVLGEKLRRHDRRYGGMMAVGLAICFFGQTPASSTAPAPAMGNALAILSSIGWAVTLSSLRVVARGSTSDAGLSAVVVGNTLAAVLVAPWTLPYPNAPVSDWLTLVYLGVVQIGLAYICLTRALGHLPALDVALLLLLEPVLNPVWTWLARGEQPGLWVVAGGACILMTSALKARGDARGRPGAAAST